MNNKPSPKVFDYTKYLSKTHPAIIQKEVDKNEIALREAKAIIANFILITDDIDHDEDVALAQRWMDKNFPNKK